MNESADTWADWFRQRLGLRLPELALDWPVVVEALERRHLIVHNDGIVDARYVAKAGLPGSEIGNPLITDHDYVHRFLRTMLVTGIRLALAWWEKVVKQSFQACHAFVLVVFFNLEARELRSWAAALGQALLTTPPLPPSMRKSLQLRTWNARKRSEGLESIRDEVHSWRSSASEPEDSLLVAALLNDLDEAFRILPDLLEAGHVSVIGVAGEVVYEDLVQDGRWPAIVRSRIPATREDWETVW